MPLLRGVFSSRPQGAVSSYDRLVQLETTFLRSVRGGVAISARHAFAFYGRGQPLSFTLSFGEIPWFDEEG